MAALYSQGLAWEQMHHLVREYARQMSSVQHLLWDLTLPIMSVFNGVGFDRVVRETFKHGAQQIEDLWLRYAIVASLPEVPKTGQAGQTGLVPHTPSANGRSVMMTTIVIVMQLSKVALHGWCFVMIMPRVCSPMLQAVKTGD